MSNSEGLDDEVMSVGYSAIALSTSSLIQDDLVKECKCRSKSVEQPIQIGNSSNNSTNLVGMGVLADIYQHGHDTSPNQEGASVDAKLETT